MTRQDPAPRRLALFALTYAGSAAFQKAIGFLAFLLLAHWLSVENYARFGLMYALQAGMAGLTGAGIVESVLGLLRDHRSAGSTTRLFAAGNSVFGLQASLCLLIIACVAWSTPGLLDVPPAFLFVIAASGVSTAFAVLQSQWARLEERHELSTAFGFFPPLAGWIGGLVCFVPFRTPEAFFVGVAIGVAGALAAFAMLGRGCYDWTFDKADTRPILLNLAPFVVIVFVMWIGGYGNTWLIEGVFTHVEVARFTFLYTLSSIMQIVATSLNQVWLPRFVRLLGETSHEEVERRSRGFFYIQGVIIGFAGAAILVAVPFAIGAFGDRLAAYHGATKFLFCLLAAYAVSIPWYHSQNYFSVHARGKLLLKMTLASSAVGLAVWILLMTTLGEIGIYLGFLAFTLLRTLPVAILARIHWRTGLRLDAVAIALLIQCAGLFVSRLVS